MWIPDNAKQVIPLVQNSNAKFIAEIGVYKGHTTQAIYSNCIIQKYALVDPWKCVNGSGAGSLVKHDQKDWDDMYYSILDRFRPPIFDVFRESSLQAVEHFSDGFFDLVYIDANHTPEDLEKDILAWLPKVREGGILCGDDYSEYGLSSAVKKLFCKFSVIKNRTWWVQL